MGKKLQQKEFAYYEKEKKSSCSCIPQQDVCNDSLLNTCKPNNTCKSVNSCKKICKKNI